MFGMIRSVFSGILVFLFQFLIWKYWDIKEKKCIVYAIVTLVIAVAVARISIVIGIASVVSSVVVLGLCSLFNKSRDKGTLIQTQNIVMVIISLCIICAIALIIGVQIFFEMDSFVYDVMDTYISNLYGTVRFSAVPFIDLCVMHFVYLHVIIFYLLKKRIQRSNRLFFSITLSIVIYVFLIGGCYVIKWANENIVCNGEYLTGFERYMTIIVAMIFGYWAYVIANVFVNRIRNK